MSPEIHWRIWLRCALEVVAEAAKKKKKNQIKPQPLTPLIHQTTIPLRLNPQRNRKAALPKQKTKWMRPPKPSPSIRSNLLPYSRKRPSSPRRKNHPHPPRKASGKKPRIGSNNGSIFSLRIWKPCSAAPRHLALKRPKPPLRPKKIKSNRQRQKIRILVQAVKPVAPAQPHRQSPKLHQPVIRPVLKSDANSRSARIFGDEGPSGKPCHCTKPVSQTNRRSKGYPPSRF
jgi:hypothetical protein